MLIGQVPVFPAEKSVSKCWNVRFSVKALFTFGRSSTVGRKRLNINTFERVI